MAVSLPSSAARNAQTGQNSSWGECAVPQVGQTRFSTALIALAALLPRSAGSIKESGIFPGPGWLGAGSFFQKGKSLGSERQHRGHGIRAPGQRHTADTSKAGRVSLGDHLSPAPGFAPKVGQRSNRSSGIGRPFRQQNYNSISHCLRLPR